MPASLKQIQTGPEPQSARKIREFLEKHVKSEAPYYTNEELMQLLKLRDGTVRGIAKPRLSGWFKRVGRHVYWSTPEHIKKL